MDYNGSLNAKKKVCRITKCCIDKFDNFNSEYSGEDG